MSDVTQAVQDIEFAFSSIGYPDAFLVRYDQLECLASHRGLDTFLVCDKRGEHLYVAKCYHRAVYPDAQETGILRTLSHDGLPAFADAFQNERMTCTVRAYIKGTPLNQYAQERSLTRDEIVVLCVKLCDILIYLHEQTPPIIHRDIKPQNVIVREDGSVALIDFDTARTYKNEADVDTLFFGTKGYAPPEQYGFAQTDCRADIYSFGILLRFLLTGSTRENPNVRVYPPLGRILSKCTAFSPKERFSDMRTVKKALLAANPKSQFLRKSLAAVCALAACALLAFGGVKLYRYVTFDPFADGHIPLVMQDDARVADAVSYLQEKYNTHLFDETSAYMTIGIMKDALVEMYGMDYDYAHTPSIIDPPAENPDCFMPWSLGDEQYFDRKHMAYFATKIYWPEVAADWSSLKEAPDVYPGILVSMTWCEAHGILTGVKRPDDITRGEAAIALANADRVFDALLQP